MFRPRLSHLIASLAAVPLLALTAGSAQAQISFVANLTPDQETTTPSFTTSSGGPRPASFGSAVLTLNPEQTALTMSITVFNIDFTGSQTPNDANDDLRSAHIHAPAPPGSGAGVVWGFIGTPFNDTNPTDTVTNPFVNGVGATITSKWDAPEGNNTTLTAQLPNIMAGLSYLNFHTAQNPGGEIRGQIVVAPEPGTLALLAGVAALPVAGLIRRRCVKRG